MGLTIEQMQGASMETKEVETPEWGGNVRIRTLRANELPQFQDLINAMNPEGEKEEGGFSESQIVAMANCVVFCMCDDDGARIGDDHRAAYALAMIDKPLAPMQRTLEAAMKLNGLSDNAVEDAVKN